MIDKQEIGQLVIFAILCGLGFAYNFFIGLLLIIVFTLFFVYQSWRD